MAEAKNFHYRNIVRNSKQNFRARHTPMKRRKTRRRREPTRTARQASGGDRLFTKAARYASSVPRAVTPQARPLLVSMAKTISLAPFFQVTSTR